MRLDEDDLYDYEDDSFDEDEAVSEVVRALKPVPVTPAEAEAELEKTDWDVDVAVANLKKRAKPKPQPKPEAKDPPKGKLTPLQMLAQRRNRQASPNDSPSEGHPETAQKGPEPDTSNAPKKLSLAELAAQRKKAEPAAGALAKLRLRKESASPQLSARNSPDPTPKPPKKSESPRPWQPEISFEVPKASLGPPSLIGAVIAEHEKSLWNSRTNSLATAKNAANAFSQPSPDDVVKNAQNGAFKAGPKDLKNKASTNTPNKTVKNTSQSASTTAPLPSSLPASKASPLVVKTDLVARLSALDLKPSCSFVVIGHVDAGKSTLMGRLLLDSGALSAKTVQKFEHESAKVGKSSFWLAWALDATTEERRRGVTVDIGEASFQTKTTNFTVLDAPGHKDYVPNMIAGVAQADVAVLVVDSDTNAFESGFSLDGQTKEHAVLARSLGIDRILVAVNKMDTQNWNELRFIEISTQLTDFLTKKVGFQADNISFVPTSGLSGVNVVKKVEKGGDPKWYDGPSLVEALDTFAHSRKENTAKASQPLRFSVSNSFTEPFQSTVTVSGRVLTGCVEAGDSVEIANSHEIVKVKSISDKEFLAAGDQGELKLVPEGSADPASTERIRPGDIIGGAGAQLSTTQQFTAKIRLFELPRPILPGTPLAFHMGRVEDTVKVVSILGSLDPKLAKSKLRHLGKGSAARVVLQLTKPTVLTPPEICKDLGRFVLRLNGATIGGGVVEDINT